MAKYRITYMSGAGNLFSVIDNRQYRLTESECIDLAKVICAKQKTEGLIVMDDFPGDLLFNAEFYNPDGSTGAMCGNGARCAVRFASDNTFKDSKIQSQLSIKEAPFDKGELREENPPNPLFQRGNRKKTFEKGEFKDNEFLFTMVGREYKAEIKEKTIRIFFPKPVFFVLDMELNSIRDLTADESKEDNPLAPFDKGGLGEENPPNPLFQRGNKKEASDMEELVHGAYVNVGSHHLVIDFDTLDDSKIKRYKDSKIEGLKGNNPLTPFDKGEYKDSKILSQLSIKETPFDKGEDEEFDLKKFAPPLRYHEKFMPQGVNVNLYKVIGKDTIRLRTYEKGVEAETGACGTGAISTAFIAALKNQVKFPVTIIPPCKSPLIIDIAGVFPDNIEYMILEGGAEVISEENYEL